MDYVGDGAYFSGPLYLEVTCSSCLPEEYRVADFPGDHPGMVAVFNTLLGSTADTCSTSVYEAFLEELRILVKGGLSDPEVDPRPSDCKLWSLRSCSPSLSSTSLSWRTGRFPRSLSFSSCSTLIRCSTFVVQVQQVRVLAARTQSSSHSYSPFGPGRSHARCVQRQMPMVVWPPLELFCMATLIQRKPPLRRNAPRRHLWGVALVLRLTSPWRLMA